MADEIYIGRLNIGAIPFEELQLDMRNVQEGVDRYRDIESVFDDSILGDFTEEFGQEIGDEGSDQLRAVEEGNRSDDSGYCSASGDGSKQ